jgi:hypothetical protein
MSSTGWIRLKKFNLPFTYRLKYRLSGPLTLGKIKTSYRYHQDSVLITIEFDGESLKTVLENLSELLREWGRQNNVQT